MILPSPMLLHEGKRPPPFGQPGWLYEIKWDGYRLIAGKEKASNLLTDPDATLVELATRNGTDATNWFPEIVLGLAQLLRGPYIFDGEVCVLDDVGRPDFNRLQARAKKRRWYTGCDPVVYCIFDLLMIDGKSTIDLPIETPKELLAKVLTPCPPSVLYVGHFDAEHGADLFAYAKALQIEGLVAKRLGSPYLPGERTDQWIKVKREGWQDGRVWRG